MRTSRQSAAAVAATAATDAVASQNAAVAAREAILQKHAAAAAAQRAEFAHIAGMPPNRRTVAQNNRLALFMASAPHTQHAGPTALHALSTAVWVLEVPRGGAIYRLNDAPDGFYLVLDGRVALYDVRDKEEAEEDDGMVERLGRGDSFGEEDLLSNSRRAQRAEAGPDCSALLLRVPPELYRKHLQNLHQPDFEDKVEFLGRLEVFRSLPDDTLRKLAPCFTQLELHAREYLVRQGERADSMYALASGQCSVLVDPGYRPEGAAPAEVDPKKIMQVCLIGPGNIVGDMTVLANVRKRTASILCLTDLIAYKIRRTTFIRRVPAVQLEALRQVAEAKLSITQKHVGAAASGHGGAGGGGKAGPGGATLRDKILRGHDLRHLSTQPQRVGPIDLRGRVSNSISPGVEAVLASGLATVAAAAAGAAATASGAAAASGGGSGGGGSAATAAPVSGSLGPMTAAAAAAAAAGKASTGMALIMPGLMGGGNDSLHPREMISGSGKRYSGSPRKSGSMAAAGGHSAQGGAAQGGSGGTHGGAQQSGQSQAAASQTGLARRASKGTTSMAVAAVAGGLRNSDINFSWGLGPGTMITALLGRPASASSGASARRRSHVIDGRASGSNSDAIADPLDGIGHATSTLLASPPLQSAGAAAASSAPLPSNSSPSSAHLQPAFSRLYNPFLSSVAKRAGSSPGLLPTQSQSAAHRELQPTPPTGMSALPLGVSSPSPSFTAASLSPSLLQRGGSSTAPSSTAAAAAESSGPPPPTPLFIGSSYMPHNAWTAGSEGMTNGAVGGGGAGGRNGGVRGGGSGGGGIAPAVSERLASALRSPALALSGLRSSSYTGGMVYTGNGFGGSGGGAAALLRPGPLIIGPAAPSHLSQTSSPQSPPGCGGDKDSPRGINYAAAATAVAAAAAAGGSSVSPPDAGSRPISPVVMYGTSSSSSSTRRQDTVSDSVRGWGTVAAAVMGKGIHGADSDGAGGSVTTLEGVVRRAMPRRQKSMGKARFSRQLVTRNCSVDALVAEVLEATLTKEVLIHQAHASDEAAAAADAVAEVARAVAGLAAEVEAEALNGQQAPPQGQGQGQEPAQGQERDATSSEAPAHEHRKGRSGDGGGEAKAPGVGAEGGGEETARDLSAGAGAGASGRAPVALGTDAAAVATAAAQELAEAAGAAEAGAGRRAHEAMEGAGDRTTAGETSQGNPERPHAPLPSPEEGHEATESRAPELQGMAAHEGSGMGITGGETAPRKKTLRPSPTASAGGELPQEAAAAAAAAGVAEEALTGAHGEALETVPPPEPQPQPPMVPAPCHSPLIRSPRTHSPAAEPSGSSVASHDLTPSPHLHRKFFPRPQSCSHASAPRSGSADDSSQPVSTAGLVPSRLSNAGLGNGFGAGTALPELLPQVVGAQPAAASAANGDGGSGLDPLAGGAASGVRPPSRQLTMPLDAAGGGMSFGRGTQQPRRSFTDTFASGNARQYAVMVTPMSLVQRAGGGGMHGPTGTGIAAVAAAAAAATNGSAKMQGTEGAVLYGTSLSGASNGAAGAGIASGGSSGSAGMGGSSSGGVAVAGPGARGQFRSRGTALHHSLSVYRESA